MATQGRAARALLPKWLLLWLDRCLQLAQLDDTSGSDGSEGPSRALWGSRARDLARIRDLEDDGGSGVLGQSLTGQLMDNFNVI